MLVIYQNKVEKTSVIKKKITQVDNLLRENCRSLSAENLNPIIMVLKLCLLQLVLHQYDLQSIVCGKCQITHSIYSSYIQCNKICVHAYVFLCACKFMHKSLPRGLHSLGFPRSSRQGRNSRPSALYEGIIPVGSPRGDWGRVGRG